MRVFVLGGTGFVGSAFVRHCRRSGIEVQAIWRQNYQSHSGGRCDLLVNANGNSRKWLAAEAPRRDFDASVTSVMNALYDFSFDRYVHVSSCDVYPDFSDPSLNAEDTAIDVARQSNYGFHKYLAEQLVRHYARCWLIIRLGGVLGPGLKKNPVFDLLHGLPLRVSVDSRYQYLDTDALAAIVFRLMEAGRWNETFNVAGDGTVDLRSVAALAGIEATEGLEIPSGRPECYRINIEKVASFSRPASSTETVERYLTSMGREIPVRRSGERGE